MKLRIRIMEWRMKLGLDPWARAARKRRDALHAKIERDRIRAKAMAFEASSAANEEIIITPVAEAEEGTTVFNLPKRATEKPQPTTVHRDGIEVQVFDPTDAETMALMRRFEMGSVQDHDRSETFGHQVDTTPPEPVEFDFEWTGPEDPFAGIRRL